MRFYDYQKKCKQWPGLARVLRKVLGGILLPLSGTKPEERLRFLTVKRLSADELLGSFQLMDCGKEQRVEMWLYRSRLIFFGRIVTRRLTRIARFKSQEENLAESQKVLAPLGIKATMMVERCEELAVLLDRRGLVPYSWYVLEVHYWGAEAAVRVLTFPDVGLSGVIEHHRAELDKAALAANN